MCHRFAGVRLPKLVRRRQPHRGGRNGFSHLGKRRSACATFDPVSRPSSEQVSHSPDTKLVGSYAGLLSLAVHEFRTPASVVSGYLRMLLRPDGPPLDERQRKMIEEAEKSCARLVALINEMSEISKLDGGATALKKEPFDLFPALEEVAGDMHEARDRDVRFELRGEASGAGLSGDRQRLAAAFSAVFRAILREQPASALVVADRKLARAAGGSSAVVVVAPSTDVQPAYEAPRAGFDEKRGGMGLSLPIARRIIEHHGGRIWSPALPMAANGGSGRSAIVVSLPVGEQNR